MLENDLTAFNLAEFKPPDTFTKKNYVRLIVSGPSNVGKTVCVKYLFQHVFVKQYDFFVIYSKTEDTTSEYAAIISNAGKKFAKFNKFSKEHIRMLKHQQAELKSAGKAELSIMVLMDDFSDRKSKHEDGMVDLFTMSRHDCISVVSITHDLAFIDPAARNSATHVLITKQNKTSVYEMVYNEWLSMLCASRKEFANLSAAKRRDSFMTFMNENTQDHNVLVICAEKSMTMRDPKLFGCLYKLHPEPILIKKKDVSPTSLMRVLDYLKQ